MRYFFILFLTISSVFGNEYAVGLYEKARMSVLALEVYMPEEIRGKGVLKKGIYYGTGFVIQEGWILTVRKVVQDQLEVRCLRHDNKDFLAQVVAYDDESPLVLLKYEEDDLPALEIGTNYEVGDTVFSAGNTYASITRQGQMSISKGSVSGIYDYKRWGITLKDILETDAAVNPGIYGAPLLDIEGKYIGIIFSGYSDARFQGLALSSVTIARFLQRYSNEEFPLPDDIFILQTLPVYLGANVEAKKGKVKIASIEPESPAEESLMVGDRIMQIGEKAISSPNEFDNVVSSYFPGQKILMTVRRKDMVMVIPVSLLGRLMR